MIKRVKVNLLIHDLRDINQVVLLKNDRDNTVIISDDGKIHPCICCFGCWIKTPGQCVIKDGYDHIGLLHAQCNRLIIISQCFYGSYSPFVHNVLDRSISYLLPYFITKKGETHHKCRYDNKIRLTVHFYGVISDKEKRTAEKLIAANGINHHAQKTEVYFYDRPDDIR
jgi:multimeric flavodoxin WrbA